MTGSGSVCYGLFKNENCSKAALKNLKNKYPKFSFSVQKLFNLIIYDISVTYDWGIAAVRQRF